MGLNIKELFILFMIYSFIGWVIEIIWTLIMEKRFVNRGFLIGPYLPIYGVGGILMTLLLSRYSNDIIALFIMSIMLFSILEYFTSYILEKLFNARWWDYTKYKFNINGRICLETMVPFGIAGLGLIYIINPFLYRCITSTPEIVINIMLIVLLIIFITDLIISLNVMVTIKGTIKKVKKDSTEEINKKVKEIISQTNALRKRILKAFPKFNIR